jgi:bacillithiol biosynthesis deacetylase BshB1
VPLSVLAIGAHPDDLEILCGGTLAKYAGRGDQVVMCHLTRGDKGHYRMPSDELAATRREEAQAAARVIGAESLSLELDDNEVCDDLATRRLVIDVIRQARPDVIITHAPHDTYHADHGRVSQLVLDASFDASVPYIKTGHPHHDAVPAIYYMETILGLDFQPQFYVDVSQTFDTKREMLAQHRSQLTWLKEHDDLDVLEQVETTTRFRGWQCGVAYAEGFIPCLRWPRVIPGSLLP